MVQKINDLGVIFRFITPIMLGIIGFVGIKYLDSIDHKFASIDMKFDNFIETYHLIDKRVDKLEYRVFGSIQEAKNDRRNPERQ